MSLECVHEREVGFDKKFDLKVSNNGRQNSGFHCKSQELKFGKTLGTEYAFERGELSVDFHKFIFLFKFFLL